MVNLTVQSLSLDLVDESQQVREHFDPESLLSLAGTIGVHGIQQPVVVRRVHERYQVVTGGRRCQAAKIAGLTHVPAIILDRELTEAELLELQLLENCARVDLNPVEKARAFNKWMSLTGRTASELARIAGVSAPVLSKLSALLVLAPDVLALVESGKLPYSAACEIARFSDPGEQRRLADQVVNGGLSRDKLVAQAKVLRATRGAPRRAAPRPRTPRERVVIKLDGGGSISVSAPALSVEALTEWFSQLAERIRTAGADGRPLTEVVKDISRNGK